jgi:hypothetical protein
LIANSTEICPPGPAGYWYWTRAEFRTLSLESFSTSPRFSPSSGAKVATYTKPTTFGALVAALVMTAPP